MAFSGVPNESQVLDWYKSENNWGRWGQQDQMGALNLITPAKRTQAAALVQSGETVSCARPITTEITPDISFQVQRYMVDSGEGRDTDPLERRNSRRGAAEFIGMVFHGQTITHIDALSHYSFEGLMYNGVPAGVVTSREGAQSHAIDLTAQGLVTRGVLLDIAKVRGVDWLPPNGPVMPEDLDAAERDHGVTVESGDILLVRTGNYRRRIQEGPLPPTEPSVACHVACAVVQGTGNRDAGHRHLQRRSTQRIRQHRLPGAHCLPGLPGRLAHRQRQPGRSIRSSGPPQPLRVHVVHWTPAPSARHRKPGESHRDLLTRKLSRGKNERSPIGGRSGIRVLGRFRNWAGWSWPATAAPVLLSAGESRTAVPWSARSMDLR
jgi:hypothetical protein